MLSHKSLLIQVNSENKIPSVNGTVAQTILHASNKNTLESQQKKMAYMYSILTKGCLQICFVFFFI